MGSPTGTRRNQGNFELGIIGREKLNNTSEQIISKNALAETIRETELLLEDMQQNSDKFQPWHRRVVGDNLRTLRMISRKLGYAKAEG